MHLYIPVGGAFLPLCLLGAVMALLLRVEWRRP
jgi:hypothetical protein